MASLIPPQTKILTNSTRMSHNRNSIWSISHFLRMSHSRNSIRPTSHYLRISHNHNSIRPTSHFLRMSHSRNSIRPTSHSLRMSHSRNSIRSTSHSLRISHSRNSIRPTFHLFRIFHIRRPRSDGRGGRFNFPRQTCPDPSITLIQIASVANDSHFTRIAWLVKYSRFAESISTHNQKANSDNTTEPSLGGGK